MNNENLALSLSLCQTAFEVVVLSLALTFANRLAVRAGGQNDLFSIMLISNSGIIARTSDRLPPLVFFSLLESGSSKTVISCSVFQTTSAVVVVITCRGITIGGCFLFYC